jgi:hypothetical protein
MAKIFLCHANEDKPQVREVYQRLKAEGFEPWLDEEDLIPGQLWDREIRRALRNSDIILIFFSQTSIAKRGYVQREMKLALEAWEEIPEGQIHTIPVRLDACAIPERFKPFQWVDLFDDYGFERIVDGIRFQQSQHDHHAASQHRSTLAQPAFQEMNPVWRSSSFLNDGEVLVRLIPFGRRDRASDVIWYNTPQAFLRLIPTKPIPEKTPFELHRLIEAQGSWLTPFGHISDTWSERNKYGAVRFEAKAQKRQNTADCFSQVFKNGEIWGIDKSLLDAHGERKLIPSTSFERQFESALRNFLHVAQHGLVLNVPLQFVAGLSDVEGFSMGLRDFGRDLGGDVVEDEIVYRGSIDDYAVSVHTCLLPFFKQIWEACGIERPEDFRQNAR